jgi:hypothetical protein
MVVGRDERPGGIENAASTIAEIGCTVAVCASSSGHQEQRTGSAHQADPLGCSLRATMSDNIVQVLALECLAPSGSLLKLAEREIETLRQRPGSR